MACRSLWIILLVVGLEVTFTRCQRKISLSSPYKNQSFCPGSIMFVCNATNFPFLFEWYINGSSIGRYVFSNSDTTFPQTFPVTDVMLRDGITVKIIDVETTDDPNSVNIISVLNGTFEMLEGTLVQCGYDDTVSETYHISLLDPKSPENVEVKLVYSPSSLALTKITVNWNVPDGLCSGVEYSYQVILQNGSSHDLDSKNVTCTTDTTCETNFDMLSGFNRYLIRVAALDGQGAVVAMSNVSEIDGFTSNQTDIFVEFLRCTVRCHSNFNGTCEIQYTQNTTTLLENSINGSVNSVIEATGLQSGKVYFVAYFNVGENTYELRNSSMIQDNNKWTGGILTLVILGLCFMILSVFLIVSIGVGLYKKWITFKDAIYWKVTIFLIAVSVVFLLVSICCWIAGLVEVNKSDNCGNVQLPERILIAACCFSFVIILLDVIFIAVYYVYDIFGKPRDKPVTVSPNNPAQETLNLYGVDDDAKKKNDHGISKAEGYLSGAGHKKIGENTNQGLFRVKEEVHQAIFIVDQEQSSNTYDKINHEGQFTKEKEEQLLPPGEYGGLDNGGASEGQEYESLKHGVSVQPKTAVTSNTRYSPSEYDHIEQVDKDSHRGERIDADGTTGIGGLQEQDPQSTKQSRLPKFGRH